MKWMRPLDSLLQRVHRLIVKRSTAFAEGLRPAGIGPRFRVVDDERRAEDVLRLQANPAPVDVAGLVVEGDLGRALADAVLGDGEPFSSG